ncbi:hypothetical protein [Tumebacillus permanentifrigoris]|uniref:Uncharacterized protein n=1 Tax=Tumebacillus permanentifrigoris TaxID=378543 RepID=A0A316DAA9_9BACL|nr:hypothetical protein [Tumebacillus permanentifrigoris]PWK13752.1 hypothetical protein C7459_10630 [Tumebacillus permanentifrigoris]
MSMNPPVQVNYDIKTMERCVSATFAFGPTSLNNPYFTIYFVVNNAGIVAIYDKSMPLANTQPNENNEVPFLDELKTNSIAVKQGSNKYEILRFIHEELERIGEKLQREGRPLSDADLGKLMTKVASKFEGAAPQQ